MPLQGTLRDFGIADIFQLIAQQQKTGVLQLRRTEGGLDVLFNNGLICGAIPPGADPNNELAQQLVRSAVLTPPQIRQAQEVSIQNLSTFRDALVDAGLVDNDQLTGIEKLYCMEAIYDLFTWGDGSFAFAQQEIQPNADSFQPVSAEHILMDGFRMVDEWPGIKRTVPDPNARVQKLSTPQPLEKPKKEKKKGGGDSFDLSDIMDDEEEEDSGSGLDEEQQKILDIAQTGLTVQTIIDRSRMGAFEATKAVAALVTKGYLKLDIVSAQLESAADFFEEEEPVKKTGLIAVLSAGVISLGILAIGAPKVLSSVASVRRAVVELHQVQIEQGLKRVRSALEVYKLLNGSYPDSLAELERNGIAPPELGLSRKDSPYRYNVENGSYQLGLASEIP